MSTSISTSHLRSERDNFLLLSLRDIYLYIYLYISLQEPIVKSFSHPNHIITVYYTILRTNFLCQSTLYYMHSTHVYIYIYIYICYIHTHNISWCQTDVFLFLFFFVFVWLEKRDFIRYNGFDIIILFMLQDFFVSVSAKRHVCLIQTG